MSGESWLVPRGADGGDFKYEVQFLQSIARPLEESTEAARKLAGESAEQRLEFMALNTLDKTGASEVTDAVDSFLAKWSHGLGCIADDADVIVAALASVINTFLVTDTKVAYEARMVELQKQQKDDRPVTSWLEGHGITGKEQQFRPRTESTEQGTGGE
ncbi:hypothetical protein RKD49_005014 [Streptomyces glaucescens]|uniref:hypothetical protein n=1 Tax=unclassified Streptomyces TaxID=2593676 RepID=UPI00093A11AD|nr:hypothetical protein [Streptomyces sp. TSRI0107]OKJ87682.1 hypothetical protein AMK31_11010 [Streptomyces sp. TSRI0107]